MSLDTSASFMPPNEYIIQFDGASFHRLPLESAMTRVSEASVGWALIFQLIFSSYRKLRILLETGDVPLVVGWGVEVVGADV